MADLFDSLLDKTCTIQELDTTAVADGYNQPPEEYVPAATGVPCRLSTLSRGREFNREKLVAIDTLKVYMRYRTLTAKNRLVIDGVTYKIIAPPVNPSGMNHHLEVLVEVIATR